MIFQQLMIGFVLRNIVSYTNIFQQRAFSSSNLDNTLPHRDLIQINNTLNLLASSAPPVTELKAGYDDRFAMNSKNKKNMYIFYENYIKLALLKELENDNVSQHQKQKLINNYEKTHGKSKFANNFWKGLYNADDNENTITNGIAWDI